MSHIVIKFDYKEYVFPIKEGIQFLELFAKAKRYSKNYNSATGSYNYYVWDRDNDENEQQATLISDELYNMAKLAGKPE